MTISHTFHPPNARHPRPILPLLHRNPHCANKGTRKTKISLCPGCCARERDGTENTPIRGDFRGKDIVVSRERNRLFDGATRAWQLRSFFPGSSLSRSFHSSPSGLETSCFPRLHNPFQPESNEEGGCSKKRKETAWARRRGKRRKGIKMEGGWRTGMKEGDEERTGDPGVCLLLNSC